MVKQDRLLGIFILGLLVSCSMTNRYYDYETIDTGNLYQLERVRANPRSPTSSSKRIELSAMRIKVLEDSAMSIGAQAGLAWASSAINAKTKSDKKYLDSIFNFNGMMLSHGVIPPVLEEANNTLNLSDPNTIRVSDKTYKIVMQARFATTPPNWREYIWLPYIKPDLPHKSLLPRNDEEQKIWKHAIDLGWQSGIDQAYSIFQQNLARLKRDFRGMLLYRKLLQQKMISPPFVARTELGITGDGNDMHINDQVLRIVELPKLQSNGRSWRAVVVPGNE